MSWLIFCSLCEVLHKYEWWRSQVLAALAGNVITPFSPTQVKLVFVHCVGATVIVMYWGGREGAEWHWGFGVSGLFPWCWALGKHTHVHWQPVAVSLASHWTWVESMLYFQYILSVCAILSVHIFSLGRQVWCIWGSSVVLRSSTGTVLASGPSQCAGLCAQLPPLHRAALGPSTTKLLRWCKHAPDANVYQARSSLGIGSGSMWSERILLLCLF